jgi:Ca2+-binding EF-hand superfamily protein
VYEQGPQKVVYRQRLFLTKNIEMKYQIIFFATVIMCGTVACNENRSGGTLGNDSGQQAGEIMDNNAFNNAFTESEYFDKWDQNGDGIVAEDEFYQSYVRTMDEDGDGQINADEWKIGMGAYYRGFDLKPEDPFEELAADSNGQISLEETENQLREIDYIDEWNTDGDEGLTEEELAKGVFQNLDEDGDGIVEAEKYTDYFEKYKDS